MPPTNDQVLANVVATLRQHLLPPGSFSLVPDSVVHLTHPLLTAISDVLYLLEVTMVTLLASPCAGSAVSLAAKRQRTLHGLGSLSLALTRERGFIFPSEAAYTGKLLSSRTD